MGAPRYGEGRSPSYEALSLQPLFVMEFKSLTDAACHVDQRPAEDGTVVIRPIDRESLQPRNG